MLLVALAHLATGLDLTLLLSLKMEKFLTVPTIEVQFVLLLKILKIRDPSSCCRLDDDDNYNDDYEVSETDCTRALSQRCSIAMKAVNSQVS
jgi:hypothetical protein